MTMDHAEALEHIEIAAAEPDGLERLMAGDTPEAAAVAGHLAGCGTCVAELARIRRVADLAREAVLEQPDPALKERTLAFVRATGVDRSASAPAPVTAPATAPVTSPRTVPGSIAPAAADQVRVSPAPAAVNPTPVAIPVAAAATAPTPSRRRPLFAAWAGIAAALLVVGVAGFALGGGFASEEDYQAQVATLNDAANRAVEMAAQPGTKVVTLTATAAGGAASGRLAVSTTNGGIVMLAAGLPQLQPGAVYGCWVEVGGERRKIGTMYPTGAAWAWAGTEDGLTDLPPGTTFGVSLVPAGAQTGQPVLTGSL
jgi:hypothetical protein